MDQLQIGRRHYEVPTTWNELRPAQLRPLLRLLTSPAPNPAQRRLALLALLIGCPQRRLARLPLVTLIHLLPLVDFLSQDEQPLTTQLVPAFRLPWRHDWRCRTWVGPLDRFRNLSFGEFIFADTLFVHHARTGQAAVLDRFLAVLYRPQRAGVGPHQADYSGDAREAFNEHRLGYHAGRLRHLPAITKLAILAWYRGCRQQLATDFPDVFVPAEPGARTGSGDWGRVLRQLSGHAFGPLDQTARQPIHTILAEIQDKVHELDRLQAQRPPAYS